MSWRSVGEAAQPRSAALEAYRIDASSVVLTIAGLAAFALHYLTAGRYGYQRDELYFIECARHLAWGYVDQPPLIALIAMLTERLFGDSLRELRLLPAMAAGATVAIAGLLARRAGGGLAAQAIAMLGVALAPFFLAVGNLLTMNAFEPLIWMGAAFLLVKAEEKDEPIVWAGLGIVVGLGLINKYTMFFFAGASIVALALSPSRGVLRRRGFFAAAAIALAFVAPTLVWQARHGWPQLAVLRNAAADKNIVVGPLTFYVQQILMMNPLAAPVWIAGLWTLLRNRRAPLHWYGLAYVLLSIVYLSLGAKVYYLAPIYPVLFATGAPLVERTLARARWTLVAYPLAMLAVGLAIAPEAFPLLPLRAFLVYQRFIDVRGVKMERHPEGRVPQQFADQLGWGKLVSTVADAYAKLPPAQQREAAIFTHDYGQASALDFFGARYGLPRAISGHNEFYLYGTRGASGHVVLAVDVDRALLQSEFRRIERVAVYHDEYVLPDFNDFPIYLCTQPIRPLTAWWPAAKRYI
ncbi:MAG: glycosyltransferase family 39 protein [Vulcanimicrobiaceae bacterium]